MTDSDEKFSVCQFFTDESYEYDVRNVPPARAMERFVALTKSVGAQIGTTRRVIITDTGDEINAEWVFGKGLVYPPKGTP